MKGYFAKYIPAVFFFSLFFIFFNAVVSFHNLQTLLRNESLTNLSQQIILKITAVNLSMKDVEISQRNYLISGNQIYLSQFQTSVITSKKQLQELKALVIDNINQQKNVTQLQSLFTKRVSLLENRITLFNKGGISAVQEAGKTGKGMIQTKDIASLFLRLEQNETVLLVTQNNQSKNSANRTYVTILIATLLNIALIFITYYLIKRELDYRSNMEKRKDEFISIATHELKTPITSLQVFAQILQKKLQKDGDRDSKQYSIRITTQVSRLTELINDLLDVSRLQLGKLKFERTNFDINNLVREVVETLRQTTEKHKIIIKGKITKKVFGDEDRIGQVLTNLISNAIKYSPDGKKIIITVKKDIRFATISVQDFGIGISEEHKGHIFERFYRAYGESEKNFPGLGMGLFISQEIIRRHKGKLDFTSTEGKGSTFFFTIPYGKTTIKNLTAHEE